MPKTQTVLLLHAPKQQYHVTEGYAVPEPDKSTRSL